MIVPATYFIDGMEKYELKFSTEIIHSTVYYLVFIPFYWSRLTLLNMYYKFTTHMNGSVVCPVCGKATSGSTALLLDQEGINVALAVWAFTVPGWDIVAVHHIPVLLWMLLAHKLWGSTYFPRFGWIVKCRNWQAGTIGVDNSSMHSALVSPIGHDLDKGKQHE